MRMLLRVLPAAVVAVLVARPAYALQCFTAMRPPSVLARGTAAERSSSLPVTFGTTFTTSDTCEYGLASGESGFAALTENGVTDLSTLLHTLLARAGRGGAGDP